MHVFSGTISKIDVLSGDTGKVVEIAGGIVGFGDLSGELIAADKENVPLYSDDDGDYVVIPSVHNEIVLNTAGYKMQDDVTVKKVPYYQTGNDYGDTIYIGDN